MKSQKDLALTWAALRALADAVKERQDALKAEFIQALEEAGTERARAELDGETVAHVSVAHPGPRIEVSDEEALVEWCRRHAPHVLVEEPERVIPARTTVALDELLDEVSCGTVIAGDTLVIEESGEVLPGVTARPRDPYLSVRFAPGGRKAILAAAEGAFKAIAPLALPGGDSEPQGGDAG